MGRAGQRRPDRRPGRQGPGVHRGLVPDRDAPTVRARCRPGTDATRGPATPTTPSRVTDVAVHANHATRHTSPLGRDFARPDRATRITQLLAGSDAPGRRGPASDPHRHRPRARSTASCPSSRTWVASAGRPRRCATSCSPGTAAWTPAAPWRTGMPCCGRRWSASLCRVDAFAGLDDAVGPAPPLRPLDVPAAAGARAARVVPGASRPRASTSPPSRRPPSRRPPTRLPPVG